MKLLTEESRRKKNSALLERLCLDLPIVEGNGFGNLVNYTTLCDESIHRWFRYREGYSTQLVKNLIKDLPKGAVIVDPFGGCGTTLIAAQELGYESYGFDINPLSTLITRVKVRNYTQSDIDDLNLLKQEASQLSANSPVDDIPALSITNKIFHSEILSSLLILRRFIKSVSKEHLRDLMMVAWLSIIEGVSNVFKEGNGIKYRNNKRTSDGHVKISDEEWQKKLFPKDKFDFVKVRFSEQLSLMISDIQQRKRKIPKAHVIEASAEKVQDYLKDNSVSYIVFSPPYCNCFNYFKIFKVELWMGEFVMTYKDMQALNRRAIRSHVETTMNRDYDESISYVDEFIELIDIENLWDRRIPKAVQGYFIDMKRILTALYKVLKPGGKCVIVVGNSAYAGIIIPTDALLAKIGLELGFGIEKISVARHLTTSSQQKLILNDRKEYLRESLVFLTKQDPRLEDKKLIHVNELPTDISTTSEEVFVIGNNGLCNLTHKFHRYPGKFIPHIPRWAVNKYLDQESGFVFDPFCGSGTTLVESMLLGHSAYGMDIDPIARLISKVKTTPIPRKKLDSCIKQIKAQINKANDGVFKPDIPTLTHWFNETAVKDLSVIRDVIESYKNDKKLYDFLIVCFLAIIRRVSNADNQTQKTYVSHTYNKVVEPAKPLFENILYDYADRLTGFADNLKGNIEGHLLPYRDSRNFAENWISDSLPSIDLAVTSPPYVKTVDYVYNQMAEYFWIGDLFQMENQAKQNDYKKNYIGNQKIAKSIYKELQRTGIGSIDKISESIYQKDKKHAFIVYKFFSDMIQHFEEMKKILSPRAHYIMVIGDSIVSDIPIPTHKLIQDCGHQNGYGISNVFGYEIRNRYMRFPRRGRGGIVRYDWVVDFILS